MISSLRSGLSLLLFGVCVQAQLSWSPANITAPVSPLDPQNATAQALVYGYPLRQFLGVAIPTAFGDFGVNSWIHKRVLATAEDIAVVRPNEDTLYSSMTYDLSHGDVVIDFPKIPQDQFHLMTYSDPYGNVLASVGSGYFDEPGEYCIRMRPGGAPSGLVNSSSTYKAYINSPTTYGVILMRLTVNSTNLNALHSYQNQTTAQNVSSAATPSAPYLQTLLEALTSGGNSTGSTPNATETILGLLAAFAPYNPPVHIKQVPSVSAMLSAAGVLNGTYTIAAGVDLGAANVTAEKVIQKALLPKDVMTSFANDWSMVSTQYLSPDFGANYAVRALISRTAYLITKAPNTIYPIWTNVSTGELPGSNGLAGSMLNLGSGEAITYDFVGGHPPLKNPGFWSLTMYDADGYLIENPQGTYRLGDRDNLTYPDGTLVYPPFEESTSKPDPKPFQVLVQAADAAPPANWTSNWLPSPAGGGNFTVWLRFYGTTDELIDGGYIFPVVKKTAAITNGTAGGTTTPILHAESSSSAAKLGATFQGWWVEILGMLLTLMFLMS